MKGARLMRGWTWVRGACARAIRTEIWTPRQRLRLASILLVIIAAFAVVAYRRPLYVGDPQPVLGVRASELATKIDPNEADWPALAALPLIGEKRAKEIVTYREAFVRDHPGRRAFSSVEDLDNVKGIGQGTAQSLRDYLMIRPADDDVGHGP